MSLKVVPRASAPPYHCCVYPHLGAGQAKGYFEAELEFPAPAGLEGRGLERRIYVSVVAVEMYARHLGWISPEEHESQRKHIEALSREKAQLEAELEGARAKLEAIDVIESEGFRARKKPGRKAQEKAHA